MKYGLCLAAFAGLVLLTGCATAGNRAPKVLLVMLDGARADVVNTPATPNIKRLADGEWLPGYHTAYADHAQTVPDANPNSAPNHVAIATGVTAAKHRVYNNGETGSGKYEAWPLWLNQLARRNPALKCAFLYFWAEDGDIAADAAITRFHGSDAESAAQAVKLLQGDSDAVMIYIDAPDHGGHGFNFYPHSSEYLDAVAESDRWIGAMLQAIEERPSLADEDWLIIVTADHGGYHRDHGMWGGHATTVPLLVCGRSVAPGRLSGMVHNYDAAATALAHFGVSPAECGLDGEVQGVAAKPEKPSPLSAGLRSYLPFDDAPAGGLFGGAFDAAAMAPLAIPGSENFPASDEAAFTISWWAKLPAAQTGDALLVSNKDWQSGANPGVAVTASRLGEGAATPGICLNYGRSGTSQRADMGQFDVEAGQWMFLTLSRDTDGTMYFAQGMPDGRLYFLASAAPDSRVVTGMPWHVGQDGTGQYPIALQGRIDDLAMWERRLSVEELQSIFQAGRHGQPLQAQINQKQNGRLP